MDRYSETAQLKMKLFNFCCDGAADDQTQHAHNTAFRAIQNAILTQLQQSGQNSVRASPPSPGACWDTWLNEDHFGRQLFYTACEDGSVKGAICLYKSSPNLRDAILGEVSASTAKHESNNNLTKATDPFAAACCRGSVELVQFLNDETPLGAMSASNNAPFGSSAFYQAAINAHVSVLEYLVQHMKPSLDVHGTDEYGWTPLMCACQNGDLCVVEFLLGHFLQEFTSLPSSATTPGSIDDAFGIACSCGHLDVATRLLQRVPMINSDARNPRDGQPIAFTVCARHHNTGVIRFVREVAGADCAALSEIRPHSSGRAGRSLLHAAAAQGHLDVMGYLLNPMIAAEDDDELPSETDMIMCPQLEILQGDSVGWTPATSAHYAGQEEALEMLLWAGAVLEHLQPPPL